MPESAVRRITISPTSELAAALKDAEASGSMLIVDTGEAAYPLRVDPPTNGSADTTLGTPAAQDHASARGAISRSFGGWRGLIDADELKERLHAERGSDLPSGAGSPDRHYRHRP